MAKYKNIGDVVLDIRGKIVFPGKNVNLDEEDIKHLKSSVSGKARLENSLKVVKPKEEAPAKEEEPKEKAPAKEEAPAKKKAPANKDK